MMDPHAELRDLLQAHIGRAVVLDTAGSVLYIGTLKSFGQDGFWLEHADIHDCQEGHASKELYVHEARVNGIRTNRRQLFVMRSAVISLSALDDVVQEDLDASGELPP